MEIHKVYSVRRDVDDCLTIDMDYTGHRGDRNRAYFAYRASDIYAPMTPVITQWIADNNPEILPYAPPEPVGNSVTIIPAVVLWERMTEAEAEQVAAVMQAQSYRVRQIFITAQTYRSDHELWPLLQQASVNLFGAQRSAELLAPVV